MPIDEIHINDVDTIFETEIRDNTNSVVDISSASIKNFLFSKPNLSIVTRTGVFTTDGTDGLLRYNTLSGDINAIGIWCYQIDIAFSGGHWHSDTTQFRVEPNIG